MRTKIFTSSNTITLKHIYKILFFAFYLFIGLPTFYACAESLPFWHFEPNTYILIQGETLHLTATLCNDQSSTDNFNASTVANGAGVNYLPGQNLYLKGLDIDFSDLYSQFNSVILSPGDCHNFVWGTVTAWKIVPDGKYTIDYASINGHNWSGALVADNVFTIYVNRSPQQLSFGVLHLLLKNNKNKD
jgi:hypothetical protein